SKVSGPIGVSAAAKSVGSMLKSRASRNLANARIPTGPRAGSSTDTRRSRHSEEHRDQECGADAVKFTKFSKYTGEPADAIDLEELVKRLGDFLLQSGFESQYYGMSELDRAHSLEALKEAILQALQEGNLLPQDIREELRQMLQDSNAAENQAIKDLIEKLIERMAQEGYINPQQPPQITP